MAAKTVQIGDETISVGKFSTFKALRAGKLLTEILGAVPDLSEKLSIAAEEARKRNTVKISRAAAELRFDAEDLAKISEEGWKQSDGYLEMPASVSGLDVAAQVFPMVFEEANERVLELVALAITPNSTLKEADLSGDGDAEVQKAIDVSRRKLVHSDLDELVEVLVVVGQVVEEQFAGKAGKIRAVAMSFGFRLPGSDQDETVEEETTTSTTSKPDTSTDSPEPMAGPEPSHSTSPSPSSVGS